MAAHWRHLPGVVHLVLPVVSMDLLPLCPTSAPTSSELAEALVAFLETALHQVLCVRRVYPSATFRRVRRFGQLSWWSQSAALSAYLRDVCGSLKEVLQRQLLHRVLLLLLDEDGHECERYIFEFTPVFTQATVASNSSPLGWSGRAGNRNVHATAAEEPPADATQRYTVRRTAESSSCSSTSSTTIGVSRRSSDRTCYDTLTTDTYKYSSGSTPVRSHSIFTAAGAGSRAWRRLCAAFQDILTKLELVGCWLDSSDIDDQEDEDVEGTCVDESIEVLTGPTEKLRNGGQDQAAASCGAPAPSFTSATLLPSAPTWSPTTSVHVKGSPLPGDPADAEQRSGGARASRRFGAPKNAPARARAASGGDCTAPHLRPTATRGAQGRLHNSDEHSSSLYKQRRRRLPARGFRVQLEQHAEVLESLDATAAAVPRPLSCLDEDLRAMLLLRSRWLPSTRDSSWGLHSREVQHASSRSSLVAALLSAPPLDQQHSSGSTGKSFESSHGTCVFSRKRSNTSCSGTGSCSRSNSGGRIRLFDSFVLASVPRSMIFAREPRSCFERSLSPVLPGAQRFSRSGAALLRIIVQQPRGGLRSAKGLQKDKKDHLPLSRCSIQNVTSTMTAATDDATRAEAPHKRTKKAANESPSTNNAVRRLTRKLQQPASDEAQTDGE